jgi:hypothetical protein
VLAQHDLMERTQLFDLMGELYGMKAAFDEIMATAVKRQHEPQSIVGDLLNPKSPRSTPSPLNTARHAQAAACQGDRRLPARRHADQSNLVNYSR